MIEEENNFNIHNIDNAYLTMDQFKDCYLKNSYNDNMFNFDGSINPKYNSKKKTGVIAKIIENHKDEIPFDVKDTILKFKPNADIEMNKIINCHNKNLGCSVYECPNCHDFIFVGHTCKSRFCTSCGYKYKLNRVENILQSAYNCNHRQIVFTCAKELWPYFFVDFSNMIDIYYKAVNMTINSILNDSFKLKNGKWVKYTSKIKYTPGFFAFLHTFGRDMKWHPHIHVLIAEIKLGNNGKCYKWDYFDYNALSKRFMKILLDLMSKKLDKSFNKLVSKLYSKYKKGFYVYAEKKKIRKQFLSYTMCILNFFKYNPYDCPYCSTRMNYLCEIEGGT